MAKEKESWAKPYEITSVCKDDIVQTGELTAKQIESLTDAEMKRIANKMADTYVSNSFWIDLGIIAQDVLEKRDK